MEKRGRNHAVSFLVFTGLLLTAGPLFSADAPQKLTAKIHEEKVIKIDEVAKLVAMGQEAGNFVLVDSRPVHKFNDGHIPGALSIPDAEFDRYAGRLPKERDRLLVFYCSGHAYRTGLSSAAKAERLGYKNIRIFPDGMLAWKRSGNLVITNADDIREDIEKNNPSILVDVRPAEEARKGHIFGAVSLSGKELAQAKDKFPTDKSVPIVLYGNDMKSAVDEFRIVRGWGYMNVAVLDGGIDAWRKAGGLVVIGEVTSKISYTPKARPGEIPVEEFRKIAESQPPDKLVLDVRDEDEARQGMLRGAVNIPAGEIRERMKDIPKDREIIIYCAAGAKSEAIYHLLREAGYKAKFLNAAVRFDKDGKYTAVRE